MPSISHFILDEITDTGNPSPGTTKMQRLRNLICGGPWGNNNKIILIYWLPDTNVIGGGYWVAWEGADPLADAAISIEP